MAESIILKTDLREALKETGPDAARQGNAVKVPVVIRNREPTEAELRPFSHPDYEAPNDAGLLLLFRAPSAFSTRECGQNSASLSGNAGNSQVKATQSDSLSGKSRFQEVDAIGQTVELKIEKGDCTSSISVSARAYQLIGETGNSLFLYPVSDRFIENFHSKIGYDDPYHRKNLGYDRAVARLRDGDGNTFTGNRDQLYMLPLRVKWENYRNLDESGDFEKGTGSKTSLNFGAQVLIPVEKPFGQAGAGVHVNVTHTRQQSNSYLLTLGAGIGANIQANVLGGYSPMDGSTALTTNVTIASAVTRVDDDRLGRTSLVLAISSQGPLLKRQDYRAPPNTATFTSAQSFAAATDPETSITLSVIRQKGSHTFEFLCREDYNPRLGKFNGNNNQDFACGVKYKKTF